MITQLQNLLELGYVCGGQTQQAALMESRCEVMVGRERTGWVLTHPRKQNSQTWWIKTGMPKAGGQGCLVSDLGGKRWPICWVAVTVGEPQTVWWKWR